MPHKDIEANRRYQREYQQKRNEEASPRMEFPAELKSQRPIKNVADVLARVDVYLTLLEGGVMPIATRARTAKELLSVAIKALEVADLGGRIKRIEELLRQRGVSLPVTRVPDAGDAEESETIQ